jgi:hypothetical protein
MLTNNLWTSCASSADGSRLFGASEQPFPIFVSTNFAATWNPGRYDGVGRWVACSADGYKLVLVRNDRNVFYIYSSTNSGTTWTLRNTPFGYPRFAASSADGTTLLAAGFFNYPGYNGVIKISKDSGVTWTNVVFNGTAGPGWSAAALSADGTKMVVTAGLGGYDPYVYISTNSGTTWTATGPPGQDWTCVASSADGSRLVAATRGPYSSTNYTPGLICISTDSGATWQSSNPITTGWVISVASSADGCKLFAAVDGGDILTWQTTPHPVLSVTTSDTNLVLSWITPSQPFVLQESADFNSATWTDVTNVPVLNLPNLLNQATLPLSAANRFYRLKSLNWSP